MYAQHSRGRGQGPNQWITPDTTVEYDEAERRTAKPAALPLAGTCHPATSEVDWADQQQQFMLAMDRYKRENHRPFPTWSEVLAVLESLGYRQVAEPVSLPRFNTATGRPKLQPRQLPRVDTLPLEHRQPLPVEIVLAPELAQSYARGERSVAQVAEVLGCSLGRTYDLLKAASVAPRKRGEFNAWMGPPKEDIHKG